MAPTPNPPQSFDPITIPIDVSLVKSEGPDGFVSLLPIKLGLITDLTKRKGRGGKWGGGGGNGGDGDGKEVGKMVGYIIGGIVGLAILCFICFAVSSFVKKQVERISKWRRQKRADQENVHAKAVCASS